MPIRGSRRPSVVPISAPSFSTPPRPYIYRKIAYVFIALTVLIVIAVLWLSSVKAEITVNVKKEGTTVDTVVQLARTPHAGQLMGRVVQGTYKNRKEYTIKGAQASSTTPTTTVPVVTQPTTTAPATTPTTPASSTVQVRGTVRIVNTYSKAQPLVRTTRLLTADGKLYRIDKTVTVPAGGEISVPVYADKQGFEFAIAPTRFTIPGLYTDLQKLIYAVSDAPFTATTVAATTTPAPITTTPVRTTPTPTRPTTPTAATPEELEQSKRALTDETLEQAKRMLSAEVNESGALEGVYFTQVKTDTIPGSTPQSYIVLVDAQVTAVFYPKDDMLVLMRSKIKEKVPADRELVPFDNQAIRYQIEAVDPQAETATIRAQVNADYRLTMTSPGLQKTSLAGKSKSEVTEELKKLEGVENVEIKTRPGWLRKIPSLKDHIEVKIQ